MLRSIPRWVYAGAAAGLLALAAIVLAPDSVFAGTSYRRITPPPTTTLVLGTDAGFDTINALTVKADSFQTHTPNAILNLATDGDGGVEIGNSTSGVVRLTGQNMFASGSVIAEYSGAFGHSQDCYALIQGSGSGVVVQAVGAGDCDIEFVPAGIGRVKGGNGEWTFPAVVASGAITTGALSQVTTYNPGNFNGATYTNQVIGIGAGSFVLKLCADGLICDTGNTYAVCTLACATAAGTVTSCTAGAATGFTALTVLTWGVATSCATDPIGNAVADLSETL